MWERTHKIVLFVLDMCKKQTVLLELDFIMVGCGNLCNRGTNSQDKLVRKRLHISQF
jgi:hypothetical protein